MEIKELTDYRNDWNIALKGDNLDLLEYVVEVANKFHPSIEGPSEDPIIFNERYIESKLDLREIYERRLSMGELKDYSFENFSMNHTPVKVFEPSFYNKYFDKQIQNTIAAFKLDVSKLWYLILYVNDYVKDLCGGYKVSTLLIDELNAMKDNLSDAAEILFKNGKKTIYESQRKEVIQILRFAMQHYIEEYNRSVVDKDSLYKLKELGLDKPITNSGTIYLNESAGIDPTYQQYKFAEMMLYFLKDKKGVVLPNSTDKIYREKHFFVSMLLYIVGLYGDNEKSAKEKWYEPFYNDKPNRNLSLLVARYKYRSFPLSAPKIYWK